MRPFIYNTEAIRQRYSNLIMFLKRWIFPPGVLYLVLRLLDVIFRGYISRQDKSLLKKNLLLKNKHKGERVFVLGAGHSVTKQDLTKLKGECVISVSNTFVHPDYPVFAPRYHVLPPLLTGHSFLYDEDEFIPWLKEMETKTLDAEMFFHIVDQAIIHKNHLFEGRTNHWYDYRRWNEMLDVPIDLSKLTYPIWNVSEIVLAVALYLGFEKIYLLGIDLDWYRGGGGWSYFYDAEKEHMIPRKKSKLSFVDSEYAMRLHAELFHKFKYLYNKKQNIYNANPDPGHHYYLDVFPQVDFDSLFG